MSNPNIQKPTAPQHQVCGSDPEGNQVYQGQLPDHPDFYLQDSNLSWWSCTLQGDTEFEISEPDISPVAFIAHNLINGNIKDAVNQSHGMSAGLLDELVEYGVPAQQVKSMSVLMCLCPCD